MARRARAGCVEIRYERSSPVESFQPDFSAAVIILMILVLMVFCASRAAEDYFFDRSAERPRLLTAMYRRVTISRAAQAVAPTGRHQGLPPFACAVVHLHGIQRKEYKPCK